MPDFEDLRLCDLLGKVKANALTVYETRNVSQFKRLGQEIQSVYDFVLTAQNSFESVQTMLKNIFSSFNYSAVIINDAVKSKAIDGEATKLLNDCLEIIIASCDNITQALKV